MAVWSRSEGSAHALLPAVHECGPSLHPRTGRWVPHLANFNPTHDHATPINNLSMMAVPLSTRQSLSHIAVLSGIDRYRVVPTTRASLPHAAVFGQAGMLARLGVAVHELPQADAQHAVTPHVPPSADWLLAAPREASTAPSAPRFSPDARAFAGEAGLQELLAAPGIAAALVVLPVDAAPGVSLRCLRAGKHVLQVCTPACQAPQYHHSVCGGWTPVALPVYTCAHACMPSASGQAWCSWAVWRKKALSLYKLFRRGPKSHCNLCRRSRSRRTWRARCVSRARTRR